MTSRTDPTGPEAAEHGASMRAFAAVRRGLRRSGVRRSPVGPNGRAGWRLAGGLAVALVAMTSACADDLAPSAPRDVRATDDARACSEQSEPIWQPRLAGVSAPAGPIAATILESAFNARLTYGVEQNVTIDDGVLIVRYPRGSINPSHDTAPVGGAGFYTRLDRPLEAACLSYRVRFERDMRFARGGKLPGLYGGDDPPSGNEPATGTNGFTVRLMWREHGEGEVYEYVVNQRRGQFGLSVGPGLFTFEGGRWTDIDLEIVLNDPGAEDGRVRLWVDGEAVIDQRGVVFRTDRSVAIDGLMFSTFFGGSDADWASPQDQAAWFDGFAIAEIDRRPGG